ncbi:MAG: folate-binding protein YgfZ [Magnetococcales bacterium]|nr:folate-binding protein YgfZ [Magnetococcales bacterium]
MYWFDNPPFLPPTAHLRGMTGRDAGAVADFGAPEQEFHTLMEGAAWVDFSHLGMLALSGPERLDFLSGLITHQVRHLSADRSLYAALLTPQGRYLWDFTLLEAPASEEIVLINEAGALPELRQQLAFYILRSKVQVREIPSAWGVMAIVGAQAGQAVRQLFPHLDLTATDPGRTWTPEPGVRLWQDPRHEKFGWRLLLPAEQWITMGARLSEHLPLAGQTAWEAYRIRHGLPRGGNEWVAHETLPLEAGLWEMNGVDFNKGCYVGQETTARTYHRATLKKRLFLVEARPPHGATRMAPWGQGTPVQRADGKEAGVISSRCPFSGRGLALLRLADVAEMSSHPLFVQGEPLAVRKPDWAQWS